MSRKLQFVAALLILSSLSLGTLNALPLHPAPAPTHEGGALMAIVDWMISLFSWEGPHGDKAPKHPQTKYASQLDPDGHH
jgi:hypothetical protein